MKFLDRLDLYKTKLKLNEAEEAPLPPGASAGNAEDNPTPQEAQQTQEQPAEQPAEQPTKLSPEGEVLLIRLLKKAFVIEPKPEDIEAISEFDDINESNARDSLQKIIGLMKKYSTDIDIEIK